MSRIAPPKTNKRTNKQKSKQTNKQKNQKKTNKTNKHHNRKTLNTTAILLKTNKGIQVYCIVCDILLTDDFDAIKKSSISIRASICAWYKDVV